MGELLLNSNNLAFTIALVIMLIIAILEGLGTVLGYGLSSALEGIAPELDLDTSIDADVGTSGALSRFLGWLRIGKVPILMLLIIFLFLFGIIGLFVQICVKESLGFFLHFILAIPIAIVLSLPCVRVLGGLIEKLMPKDETTAVSSISLIGRVATITLGVARVNYSAEAKVRDQHGLTHYIRVEPESEEFEFKQGDEVLLVSMNENIYKAISNPNHHLSDN